MLLTFLSIMTLVHSSLTDFLELDDTLTDIVTDTESQVIDDSDNG